MKTDTLQNRLKKGLSGQAFAQFVNLFIQMGSVPLLLYFWGAGLYGEWLILSAIPAYLAVSDIGFAGTAAREMNMLVARGDHETALETFQSTWILIICVSLLVLLLVTCVALLAPLNLWLNLLQLDEWNTGIVVILLSVHVLLSLQTNLMYAGFMCEGNYGLGTFFLALLRLIEFSLLGLSVFAGGGPVTAALSLVAGRFLGAFAMWQMLRRVNPWVVYGMQYAKIDTLRRLTRPALAASAFPVANALNIQGMRIVVGIVLGPVSVVVFSTLRTLTRFGTMMLRSVNSLVQPEIGVAFGKGEMDLLRQLHRRSCQTSLWASLAFVAILVFFGDSIFGIWTNGQVEMDRSLFFLLIGVAIANAFWFTSLMVPYATNRHERVAMFYVAVNLLTVLASYWLGQLWGLNGAGVVLLIAEMFMALYVIPNSLFLSQDRFLPYASTILRPPLFLLNFFKKAVRER